MLTMVRKILIICVVAALALTAGEAGANNPTRHAMQKRAEVTVHQLTPIGFGTFASTGHGGAITIDAGSGARTLSGSVSTLSGGDYGQAEFIVSGHPGEEILVSPPASTILNSAGTNGDMVITNFKVSPAEIVTLDRQGIAKIKIGGTLKVPGNVLQGKYTGFFNVTARYMR